MNKYPSEVTLLIRLSLKAAIQKSSIMNNAFVDVFKNF